VSVDVQDADRALVAALAKGDVTTAVALLDDDFNWVDANGRVLTKLQLAQSKPPLDDEAGLTPVIHRYGDVATFSAGRDKLFVLRIWAKRADGWRLHTYHEVLQAVPPALHGAELPDYPARRAGQNHLKFKNHTDHRHEPPQHAARHLHRLR
jgi:hypothetical protein